MAGTADRLSSLHQENRSSLPNIGLHLSVYRPKKYVFGKHRRKWVSFDSVFFVLTLLAVAMIPLRIYLFRWIWAECFQFHQQCTALRVNHWPYGNCAEMPRGPVIHHNIFGLYVIFSAALRHGHATPGDRCKQSTEKRKLTTLSQKTCGLLLLLLLLSGDVHLNPGPVAGDASLLSSPTFEPLVEVSDCGLLSNIQLNGAARFALDANRGESYGLPVDLFGIVNLSRKVSLVAT